MKFLSTRVCSICRANGFVGKLVHKREHVKRPCLVVIKYKYKELRGRK